MIDQERYDSLLQVANVTGDGLGLGIDQGIKKVVAALWYRGLETTGSCEGHLDWGLPFPWIELNTAFPKFNLSQRLKVEYYLKEFNKRKSLIRFLFPLKISYQGIDGGFRIQHYRRIQSNGIKSIFLLGMLQNEIHAFADFLMEEDNV